MKSTPQINILFCVRKQFFTKKGGDSYQILLLKKLLEKNNFSITLSINLKKIKVQNFHLIHFFNLSRIDDTYQVFKNAQKYNIKTCLTPIFQNLTNYNKKGRFSIFSNIIKHLSYNQLEKIRLFIHLFSFQISFNLFFKILFKSYQQLGKDFLNQSNLIFCNSHQEKKEIEKFFNVKLKNKVEFIKPAIDTTEISLNDKSFLNQYPHQKYLLIVGRIEDLKNQVTILEALEKLNFEIVFIGKFNKNHQRYTNRFKKLIQQNPKAFHYPNLTRKLVLSAIQNAEVILQVSCFENFGLVSLEAHLFNKKLLISKESFFNHSLHTNYPEANPYSKKDIHEKVLLSINDKNEIQTVGFSEYIKHEDSFISNTINAYLKILS
ncbi:MAG: hypothetical protein COB02_02745 [Candidatus Cloacimonadota bacterium]|nr:MAG: hypothetical protein COB02_02745 [Candidatus Cloacimonadota bacterium]